MQKEQQRYEHGEKRLLRLVTEMLHSDPGARGPAERGEEQQAKFRDAPSARLREALVAPEGKEGEEVDDYEIEQEKRSFHRRFLSGVLFCPDHSPLPGVCQARRLPDPGRQHFLRMRQGHGSPGVIAVTPDLCGFFLAFCAQR